MAVSRQGRSSVRRGIGLRGLRLWSVRTYLVLIIVIGFLAVAAGSGYSYAWSAGRARSAALTQMTLEADRAAGFVATSVADARKTIAGLVVEPGLAAVFVRPVDCNLSAPGYGVFPQVRIDLVGIDGTVACTSGKSPATKTAHVHARDPWLHTVLQSPSAVVIWQTTDGVTGLSSIAIGERITEAGVVKGAAVVFATLPVVAPAMVGALGGPEHPSFTIVNGTTGTLISASESPKLRAPEVTRPARFPQTKTSGAWTGLDRTARYYASSTVAGGPWRIYAGIPRVTVLSAARGTLIRQGLAGAAALLLLVLAAWLLNRRVARPLRRLTAAVVQAGQNAEGGVQVREDGTTEITALAHEFNKMLDVRAGHEAQLVFQATHNPLTGLPNKSLLGDRLAHALRRQRGSTQVAVLFLGVKQLDRVTTELGRATADSILVAIATRLSAVLRPGDTAAHLNDDEFLVLCEDTGSADTARVADRLHEYLQEPFHIGESEIEVRAAIGISTTTDPLTSSEQLLHEASMAMAEAKTTGRPWVLFDDAAHAHASQNLQIERDLSQAVARHELVLHYQPVLNIATGRVIGAEALVRWQHPQRGLVPPLEFIPIAEQTGHIIPIGRFVLTEACAEAARWAAAGHPLRMSVNVSVDQLRQPRFPALVQEVLDDTGLPASQLCLEITESTLIREAGPGWNAATELRRFGVQLSIDDFGTGYSSLAYLHQLPVDELKIDRAFINRLDRDPRDRPLVEAINAMARALNLIVVAEGVETAAQLEMLAEIGCHNAQGYLIAKPQPADKFLEFVSMRTPSRAFARTSDDHLPYDRS